MQAVLRRAHWVEPEAEQSRLVQDQIMIDLNSHRVMAGGNPVELTPTEFNLLVYLMENTGKVLSHVAILQHVWGPEYRQEAEYLRVYIGRLRQKIEPDPANPRYLITERGLGYSFRA